MASRARALAYAERVLAVPKPGLEVVLRQGKSGFVLLHGNRALTRCHLSRSGLQAAFFLARALGVPLPALGETVRTAVATGVLWRAISISCLRFGRPETALLLERLLQEAERLRGSKPVEA
jgi:hypothetical protein